MAVFEIDLSELDGTQGFVLTGVNSNDRLGTSVSNAGDVNGDGIEDFIIGAPGADSSSGASYVVFGGSDIGTSGSLEPAELDGNNGFAINGVANDDSSGNSVSGAGDVNGDEIDDLIIGAPGSNKSYVVFGSEDGFAASLELSELDGTNGFIIPVNNTSVSDAGDVNGDGFGDIIIGSDGESYVIFGSGDGFAPTIELPQYDGSSNGFVVRDIYNYGSVASVSGAGDINGDGFDDVIIGAPNEGNYTDYFFGYGFGSDRRGESYIIFGSSDIGTSGGLDINRQLTLRGQNPDDALGSSVSGAGDINGDGIEDIIIGAPGVDPGGAIELKVSGVSERIFVDGVVANGRFGSSVSYAGDVNGDEIDDIIIGAPGVDSEGNDNAGASYVIFGVDIPTLELIGTNNDDLLTGDIGNDTISGLGGDDTLSGLDGEDRIFGGTGHDLITGGNNDDSIRGGAGGDRIFGGDGDDSVAGDRGNDIIFGETGDDFLAGNSGDDQISGGDGDDSLTGDRGDDQIMGEDGDDSLLGGSGNDLIQGNIGEDLINGDRGADEIFGNNGNDLLSGGAGDDTLTGGNDNDRLDGGNRNDLLIGVDLVNSDSDFGIGELDTLTGGGGSDIFVLADTDNVFYDDKNDFTLGKQDFALITDFDANRDTIQLQGSADFYILDFSTSSTGTIDVAVIYSPDRSTIGETIAVLENINLDLSLDDSAFTFV